MMEREFIPTAEMSIHESGRFCTTHIVIGNPLLHVRFLPKLALL